MQCFLPKIRNKARLSTLNISIQYCTRGYSQGNKVRKRVSIKIRKGGEKWSLFADPIHG